MASSLAYDTFQVVAREVQAFGDAESLGLAAIAFAIFIGGFVAVTLWQFVGRILFGILVGVPWSKFCCCISWCYGRKYKRRHHKSHHNYSDADELVGEVRPKQPKVPKARKRHPLHNLWHLFVMIGSILIIVSAVFFSLHVMHMPFSVIASLGIFGYIFGQAAGPIISNVFCGIIIYFTDKVEIGDEVELPGIGHGIVKDIRTLWIVVNYFDEVKKRKMIVFITNSAVVMTPLHTPDYNDDPKAR